MNHWLAHLAEKKRVSVKKGCRFSETKWRAETQSDLNKRRWNGGKVILQLFCCVSIVALFLHSLASSFSWPAAMGGSSVTCNHCYFEAKDEPLLYYLCLLMRKPEFWHSPFITNVEQIFPIPCLKKEPWSQLYQTQVCLCQNRSL